MKQLEGQAPINAHAHGDEKQAEQENAERFYVAFDLMTKFRFRQQHASDKRAKRHRQPGPFHHQRRQGDDQQRSGCKNLMRVNQCKQAENITDAVFADEVEGAQGDNGDHDIVSPHHVAAFAADKGCQRQQRNNCNVLKQQNRKRAIAIGRLQGAFIAQNLHPERRR